MPVFKRKNENFFKLWSPEMAYVLGFFTADGSMYKTKRGTHFIDFQITDGGLLRKIRNTLGSNHKIGIQKYSDRNWKTKHRLQIGSKKIFHDLLALGLMQNKSKVIRLPKIPKPYFADFLRGYFDGDGCVHFGHYWRKDRKQWKWQLSACFTSGSRLFLQDLWMVLDKYVAGGRIGEKTKGYELVFGQHDAIALFHLMYDNVSAGIFLERKYLIFQKALNTLNAGVV